jgi:hypothetical protein
MTVRISSRPSAAIPRGRRISLAQGSQALFASVRARRDEIEGAIRTRVDAISDPSVLDAPYVEGLRAAIGAALDYALAAIESGGKDAPPVPDALLTQARVASRNGVSLDTILRRYFAGYTLMCDFLVQEAQQDDPSRVAALQSAMQTLSAVFDRLVASITEEYTRASEELLDSAAAKQAERVRRLLAGELVDTTELAYDFDGWHLGVLIEGPGAADAIRELAATLDRRLLLVQDGDGPLWAWLGGRQRLDLAEVAGLASADWPEHVSVTIGEPSNGISGWRITHRQAIAAWPLAQRLPENVIRYADVALLASILQDEVLTASLHQLYLEPLARGRDGGKALRKTLRAYFAAERNVSSAAAMLGVSRRTVANRLRTVEARIGRPLATSLTEIDTALRLGDVDT